MKLLIFDREREILKFRKGNSFVNYYNFLLFSVVLCGAKHHTSLSSLNLESNINRATVSLSSLSFV